MDPGRATPGGRPLIVGADPARHPPDPIGPRLDFVEIARALDARMLEPARPSSRLGIAVAGRLGDWGQGIHVRRSDAPVVLALSEKAAMPPAFLGRRPVVAVAHRLTTPRRRSLQRFTGWLDRLARIVVLCRAQEAYLREELNLPADRVELVADKVDHRFFSPQGREPGGYVLSVGQTGRDYATLVAAMARLGLPTTIVASSPWTGGVGADVPSPPANVGVRTGLSPAELRDLYDGASVVVVPLARGLDFAAGVNAVLEAMAMAKPVVVTRTPGIVDYVDHERDGLLVEPDQPSALAEAIAALHGDPALAGRLGEAGRRVVAGGRNLDGYVEAVAGIVRCAMA